MIRYIAFLRAINVGGRFVKMADLRQIFHDLGLENTQTYIQSGNVLFSATAPAPELTRRIEVGLREALGYDVATFLRTGPELVAVAEFNPFAGIAVGPRATRYVSFLAAEPDVSHRAAVEELSNEIDRFHVHSAEVHWLYRRDRGESTVTGAQLERVLGQPATRRNVNTVAKIVAKYGLRDDAS